MAEQCTTCGQQILLRPAERDTCEACRVRGGPPVDTADDAAATSSGAPQLPPEIREALFCDHDDCHRSLLPIEEPDRYDPPKRTREQRTAEGLRTSCLLHA